MSATIGVALFGQSLASALASLALAPAPEGDAYYAVAIGEVEFVGEERPNERSGEAWFLNSWPPVYPHVAIEGPGEAYLDRGGPEVRRPSETGNVVRLFVRAPEEASVRGTLFIPRRFGDTALHGYDFVLHPQQARAEDREGFLVARYLHYRALFERRIPGAAWFRHQAELARQELVDAGIEVPPEGRRPFLRWQRPGELQDTYELFTGGRALSENLRLDRVLEPVESVAAWYPIDELTGIETRELDWAELTKGLDPQLDPLARLVPTDQHAVFFPSFSALVALVDESIENGTPILRLLEPRAEDARTLQRYERQLCMELDELARALGDTMVKTVAMTGSDPYLRTGSDVLLLFEARQPDLLASYVRGRQLQAVAEAGAALVSGEVGTVEFQGVDSGDWTISSYTARFGDVIAVANTIGQLERAGEVLAGKRPALSELDEYVFFRDRYRRGEEGETAFVVLSDATIRRWGNPHWRIGASRRTRAGALLADHQVAHFAELAVGEVEERELVSELPVAGGGAVHLTARGVESSVYGSLAFLTPIAELSIERVTKAEKEAYVRFRRTYDRSWRQFFDPIAIRLSVSEERIAADATVMPLIAGSDYRELIELTQGAALAPHSGDPHAESLFHYILAVSHESRPFREVENMLSVFDSKIASGLGWVGESIELWIDRDPVWDDLENLPDPEEFAEEHLAELPIALRVASRSPLKLAAFLAALRGYIEQAAPGLLSWETRNHEEQTYAAVRPVDAPFGDDFRDLAVFYVGMPDALVVSLREDVIRRAIDRRRLRSAGAPADVLDEKAAARPWLGESSALRVDRDSLRILLLAFGERWQEALRQRSWDNLPILNEWKRRFPDRDPLALHEELWHVRLTCPSGGEYAWNPDARTMESSVYGHPGTPERVAPLPAMLERLLFFDAGVSFENDGLRARAAVGREPR